jgi:hypothetical protein
MEAIRHLGTGELVLILDETEARNLMAVLASNSDHPVTDDLYLTMQEPRQVDIFTWTTEP